MTGKPGLRKLTDTITGADVLKQELLPLKDIRLDGGTQPRASIDGPTVYAYAEDMQRGDQFPPVDVFYDGEHYWLADGFHRVHAAKRADLKAVSANVHQGTQRDAVLYSVGVNAAHGLRRTNRDKRRAVMRLLKDEEWSKESDNWIAQHCQVSQPFVSRLRNELEPSASYNDYKIAGGDQTAADRPTRKVRRGDQVYEQQVSSGKRQAAAQERAEDNVSDDSPSVTAERRRVLEGKLRILSATYLTQQLANGGIQLHELPLLLEMEQQKERPKEGLVAALQARIAQQNAEPSYNDYKMASTIATLTQESDAPGHTSGDHFPAHEGSEPLTLYEARITRPGDASEIKGRITEYWHSLEPGYELVVAIVMRPVHT